MSTCRFSVEQTCQLLQALGMQNVSAFIENGITGGDLLELSHEELRSDLGLPPLQVQLKSVFELLTVLPAFFSCFVPLCCD